MTNDGLDPIRESLATVECPKCEIVGTWQVPPPIKTDAGPVLILVCMRCGWSGSKLLDLLLVDIEIEDILKGGSDGTTDSPATHRDGNQ